MGEVMAGRLRLVSHEHNSHPSHFDSAVARTALNNLVALEKPHQPLSEWDDESAVMLQVFDEQGGVTESGGGDSAVASSAVAGVQQHASLPNPIIIEEDEEITIDNLHLTDHAQQSSSSSNDLSTQGPEVVCFVNFTHTITPTGTPQASVCVLSGVSPASLPLSPRDVLSCLRQMNNLIFRDLQNLLHRMPGLYIGGSRSPLLVKTGLPEDVERQWSACTSALNGFREFGLLSELMPMSAAAVDSRTGSVMACSKSAGAEWSRALDVAQYAYPSVSNDSEIVCLYIYGDNASVAQNTLTVPALLAGSAGNATAPVPLPSPTLSSPRASLEAYIRHQDPLSSAVVNLQALADHITSHRAHNAYIHLQRMRYIEILLLHFGMSISSGWNAFESPPPGALSRIQGLSNPVSLQDVVVFGARAATLGQKTYERWARMYKRIGVVLKAHHDRPLDGMSEAVQGFLANMRHLQSGRLFLSNMRDANSVEEEWFKLAAGSIETSLKDFNPTTGRLLSA